MVIALLASMWGCADDGPAAYRSRIPSAEVGVPETTGPLPPVDPGGVFVDTMDTGSTPGPQFDCSTVPTVAPQAVMLDAPRGYNDLVFDPVDGSMVGSDDSNLIRATSATDSDVFVPGTDRVYKMGVLPGGDIVAARSAGTGGGIVRVAPDGGSTVIATALLIYGLAVGNDGQVYAATNYTSGSEGVLRVDPDTGDWEQIVDASLFPPRALGFNRDFDRLYIGTQNGGDVWAVDLDANLDPISDPERVATVPQGWHDTIEVDACGNVYVGSVFESAIYRVWTDGSFQILLDWDFNNYGHGLEWGDAAGGWNEQAAYVTHPYIGSRVSEVDLGVPGANWVGTVLNAGRL